MARVITNGVPKPKQFSTPMPPKGGAPLSPKDIAAVAAYVSTLSHREP
jgi:mono/diheme cytochrome c family protein